MSAWRRKAILPFPELRYDFDLQESELHELFWKIEELAENAHKNGDESVLSRVQRKKA